MSITGLKENVERAYQQMKEFLEVYTSYGSQGLLSRLAPAAAPQLNGANAVPLGRSERRPLGEPAEMMGEQKFEVPVNAAPRVLGPNALKARQLKVGIKWRMDTHSNSPRRSSSSRPSR